MLEWINTAISGVSELRDLAQGLTKTARGKAAYKRLIIRELRSNINTFELAYRNIIDADTLVEQLSNQRIEEAIENQYDLKLRRGRIQQKHILQARNQKYLGWTASELLEKIDERTADIKRIKETSRDNTLANVQNVNIGLRLSNLYHRMQLLARFLND